MSRPYESPTRKAQAEETRRKILLALVDLLVEERPATVSIPQVARRAEVSVRIVYHYFPTKEALFDGLTEAIDSILTLPDGERPSSPSSPAELVAAMPAIYRFFAANRRLFRALAVSEFGERSAPSRAADRSARVDKALAPLRDRLDPDEYQRLRGAIGVFVTSDGYEALTTVWGLSDEDASDVASWTIRTLCERARRSGVQA
jgi:AcrR family transcriptional regulator